MDSPCDTACAVGCPIRRSEDPRALAPPLGFSQRATSFIASRCQGIHQMPFSCSPTPSPKAALRAARGQRSEDRDQTSSGPCSPVPNPGTECKHRPYRSHRLRRICIPMPGHDRSTAHGPKAPAAHPVMPASRSRLASRCQNVHGVPPKAFSGCSAELFPSGPRLVSLVGLGRFERPTSRLSGVRSNQLSYRPGFRGRRSETRDQTPPVAESDL